jgi:hypothetical protein
MTIITNRQWPKDMIMPATARNHTSVYYGLAEAKIKVLVNDLLPQREIVNRIIEWLKAEIKRMSPKRYAKNEPMYQLVLQNDIGKMVNDVYSKILS